MLLHLKSTCLKIMIIIIEYGHTEEAATRTLIKGSVVACRLCSIETTSSTVSRATSTRQRAMRRLGCCKG